jgi:hypothetical protein
VLELTFNHDGRTYDLGTGYGHIAVGVEDLDGTLGELAAQGIEPERPPYSVREGHRAGPRTTEPRSGRSRPTARVRNVCINPTAAWAFGRRRSGLQTAG